MPLRDESGEHRVCWSGDGHVSRNKGAGRTDPAQDEGNFAPLSEAIPAFVSSTLPDGSVDFISQGLAGLRRLLSGKRYWAGAGRKQSIPKTSTRVLNSWQAALASGEPLEIEERLRRADEGLSLVLESRRAAAAIKRKRGNIVSGGIGRSSTSRTESRRKRSYAKMKGSCGASRML